MQLPSKKILYVLSFCVVAILIVIVEEIPITHSSSPTPTAVLSVVSTPQPIASSSFQTTTDTDWKKKFASTTFAASSDTNSNGATSTSSPLVSSLAHSILASYLTLKQSDSTITPDVQNQIIQNALQNVDLSGIDAKVYTAHDITVIQDISNNALRIYANAVGSILQKNQITSGDNEMMIVAQATDSGDKNTLNKLTPIITSYKKIITGLMKVPVPTVLAQNHLDLINGFELALQSDTSLQNMFTDAASALKGLQDYETAGQQIYDSISGIQNYYHSQSLEFNTTEPGYILMNMGQQSS